MKKITLRFLTILLVLGIVSVAFAGGTKGYKVAYPAVYYKIYEIAMSDVSAPNVVADTYEGSWYCGDNMIEVKTRFTSFTYNQSIPDLTKYSAGGVTLTGSIYPGYDSYNLTPSYLFFDYDKKLAKIPQATQYCEQLTEEDCDTTPGTCICKTTSVEVVCEDVYYNIVPGSNLILTVRPYIFVR